MRVILQYTSLFRLRRGQSTNRGRGWGHCHLGSWHVLHEGHGHWRRQRGEGREKRVGEEGRGEKGRGGREGEEETGSSSKQQ